MTPGQRITCIEKVVVRHVLVANDGGSGATGKHRVSETVSDDYSPAVDDPPHASVIHDFCGDEGMPVVPKKLLLTGDRSFTGAVIGLRESHKDTRRVCRRLARQTGALFRHLPTPDFNRAFSFQIPMRCKRLRVSTRFNNPQGLLPLHQKKANTMKRRLRYTRLAGLISMALCAASAMAADPASAVAGSGWYLGAGVGRSTVKDDRSGNGYAIDRDTHDTGYKLFAGYRFNSYFGIEGGYTDFGDEKFDWRYSADESGTGKISAKALALAATGRLPLGNDFALLGKLGASHTRFKYREDWSQPGYEEHIRESRSKTVPLLGVGAEYALAKNISLRAEYESYGKAKSSQDGEKIKVDTDLLSINLGYHF